MLAIFSLRNRTPVLFALSQPCYSCIIPSTWFICHRHQWCSILSTQTPPRALPSPHLPRQSDCVWVVEHNLVCGLLPRLVADSLKPTPIDQVLVIAHFLNSAVRVVIASGWNANPKLAKVSVERERHTQRQTSHNRKTRVPAPSCLRFALPANGQMRI